MNDRTQQRYTVHPKKFKQYVSLLFGVHIVALSLFAAFRFVSYWDEGFYLQAGRSVAEGLRVYSDFFFPQAPLYPYILKLLPGSGWDYLFEARFLSVVLSVLTMALVGLSAKRLALLQNRESQPNSDTQRSSYYSVILLALALYSLNGLFLAWNSVAKPLALSQFLLVAGIFARLLAQKRSPGASALWMFGAGVALALAAETRSPMLVVWLVTALTVWTGAHWKQKSLNTLAFLTASHLAALPAIVIAIKDTSRFFFDNFGYHLSRTAPPSHAEIVSDKVAFLWRTTLDPQLTVILLLTVVIVVFAFRHRKEGLLQPGLRFYPLFAGGLLTGAYSLAFPSHRQYVTQGLPALIVFVAANYEILQRAFGKLKHGMLKRFPGILAIVYVVGLIPYVWIYFTGPRSFDARSMQDRVARITAIIDTHSTPKDMILAEMPLFAVLADRRQLPGAEFVGFQFSTLNLGARYRYMNLLDSGYIDETVRSRKVKLVVVENTPDPGLAAALRGNYQRIFDDNISQIWEAVPDSAAQGAP